MTFVREGRKRIMTKERSQRRKSFVFKREEMGRREINDIFLLKSFHFSFFIFFKCMHICVYTEGVLTNF